MSSTQITIELTLVIYNTVQYSICRTLLYLEQSIRSRGHLALDQSKKLSVSRTSLSRIFTYAEQIFRSLEQFSLVILSFSQNFSSQISLFSTPACTIAGIVSAKVNKISQIRFVCSFF